MEGAAGAIRPGVPVPANVPGNRPLASGAGLYQICVALRERLWCVPGFGAAFLEPASPGMLPQYDPVTQLWQCFRLGTPLCVLFNALAPEYARELPLSVEGNLSSANACKALVMRFLIALKDQLGWAPEDTFTVTQLYVNDTNGFVRVVRTIERLLDTLVQCGRHTAAPEPAPTTLCPAASGDDRMRVVAELLETERKYVHDLEILQQYASALAQHAILPPDTLYLLFSNLHQLVDVQRRFLICVEENARRAPEEQHFGHVFRSMEADFSVYEPFCANYAQALEVISRESPRLMRLRGVPEATECYLEPSYDLPAFLIKPVQRICKYPLLLEQLLKRTPPDAPRHDELVEALTVIRRITDKVNETSRAQGNLEVMRSLAARVEDWKGHSLSSFGALLLSGIFVVSKGESEREFHVYLFERILLCCKEIGTPHSQGQTRSRSRGALLRGRQGSFSNSLPQRRDSTSLQLKGRIFISNILRIQAHVRPGAPDTPVGSYVLQVWWRGETENESFCIKCRNDETLRLWHTALQRLLDEYALRRQMAINARAQLPKLSLGNTRQHAAPFMQVATPLVSSTTELPAVRSYASDDAALHEHRAIDPDIGYRRPSAFSASTMAGARVRGIPRPTLPARSLSAAASSAGTPTLEADIAALSLSAGAPELQQTRKNSLPSAAPMHPTLSDTAALYEAPLPVRSATMPPPSPMLAPMSPTLSGWNPYFPSISPGDTNDSVPSRRSSVQTSPVVARVQRGDFAFECAIPAASTFASLIELVHAHLGTCGIVPDMTAVSPHSVTYGAQLYYIDDDGDQVMMYDNEDLNTAMELSRSTRTPLQLIVP